MLKTKKKKIRKNIMLDPDVNKNLELLSEKTNYSQSELIEMGLTKLDENIVKTKIQDIQDLCNRLQMKESEVINIVLKKFIS